MATGNTEKWTGIYSPSAPKSDIASLAADEFAKGKPGIVQPAAVSVAQRVNALKEQAAMALLSVASNRKILYGVIMEIKEHFHEYGFKSAAAGVETIIPRSKRWANMFCAEIEAELELNSKVGTSLPTRADIEAKKESASLKQVEDAREETQCEPEPEERPHIRTADEIKAEQPAEPAKPKATENGRPKAALSVWKKAEDTGGAFLRAIDDVNRACPSKPVHDRIICGIKDAMHLVEQWRSKV